jgi:hypothetical protein
MALARGRPERSESRDDDFLGENVGIGKIVGFFQAFISGPENVKAHLVAVDKFLAIENIPPATVTLSDLESLQDPRSPS